MLMFLSDVKINKETKCIAETEYENPIGTTHTTNESAIKYLHEKLKKDNEQIDKIFLFATNKVKGLITTDENIAEKAQIVGKTHLAYFKERISALINVEKDVVVVDFEEDIENSVQNIFDMAQKIQEYVTNSQHEIKMHADMTGGLRNSSMMMLGVMKLAEYSGLESGVVLYSNFFQGKVEEATAVYNLFNLVSGAEEFARFGSVAAIEKYYENRENIDINLKSLLAAMKKFSEQIKLCRSGEFIESIENLRQNIKEFEENITVNNHKEFTQLLAPIKDNYKQLLQENLDKLDIISWCVERGYLQQAMTLYVEIVPSVFFERKIIGVNKACEFYKEFEEEYKGEALGRRGKEYCLFNLIYPQKSIDAKIQAERDNEYKEVKKVVKAEIIMIKEKAKNFRNKEKINIDDETKRIAEKLNFLEDNLKIITNLKELNFLVKNPQKLKDDMLQSEFIEELLMKLKAVEEQEKDENKYDNQKYGIDKVKLLLNFLEKISDESFRELFSYTFTSKIDRFTEFIERDLFKIKENKLAEVIQSRINYQMIQNDRNNVNHAKQKNLSSVVELEKFIKDSIQQIKNI